MLEIWKDVKGFEGKYMISDQGRVKSFWRGGRILRTSRTRGYQFVSLCINGKHSCRYIHKLVAVAFLNHTQCGHKVVVDHINNDRDDNRECNLQLLTSRENATKGKIGLTSEHIGVCWVEKEKKWRARILLDGKSIHLGKFTEELDAAKAYQDALSHINKHGSIA